MRKDGKPEKLFCSFNSIKIKEKKVSLNFVCETSQTLWSSLLHYKLFSLPVDTFFSNFRNFLGCTLECIHILYRLCVNSSFVNLVRSEKFENLHRMQLMHRLYWPVLFLL